MKGADSVSLTDFVEDNEKVISNILIKKIKNVMKYLGPAFIVSVAYIDPGNFATNITGGAAFNYSLIWVILWSNIMAIFLQYLSAKLGIATGKNLSEMCGLVFSKKINILLWIISELAAIATTMAEFLGGALGIYLLFKIPLTIAGIITGVVTFCITYLQKFGQRIIEILIEVLIGIVCAAYAFEMFLAKPDWLEVGLHTLVPSIANGDALLIAVGMLGATVMPHVIFLHSQLVQKRNQNLNLNQKKHHLSMEKIDIVIAMNIAFIVNAAMVIVSAAVFFKEGIIVNSIEDAHRSLEPLLGSFSSMAFAVALLSSGFSSSAVGTMAGETVMDGFINIKFSIYLKRLVTIIPSVALIFMGVNPMKALIMSQVILSFALPFAIIPMLLITSKKEYMGDFANKLTTTVIGWAISLFVISLNAVLLYTTFKSAM
ncbi:MAG: manganese transport protein [Thermoanaerobacterium sp.]|uniref:Nramp family divalent metal transporter n=1 Tax=Thermoanaerobacterium thermosaccharolyticum TaxID=1517 RepID=UPI0024AB691C|nr:manganese transport protein [Thermoanaerobacterium sp.]MDK2805825.1 manganese transport protein [Thermoanaerobacterium sp.]WHE07405.1 Nramp family divalent metal transporter [Thermoanaerobacterium thermosaccharolyticum]